VLLAMRFRANLGVSLLIIWLTNPITYPPIFFAQYKLGRWLLGGESAPINWEFTFSAMSENIGHIWKPLYLGGVVFAVLCSVTAFVGSRVLWHWHTIRRIRRRERRKALLASAQLSEGRFISSVPDLASSLAKEPSSR